MKFIIIIGDGMADYPIDALGGKTPLMAAKTPNIDRLCALGRTGFVKTIPDDMPAGSAVANLSILGYDVHDVYEGRGVLEAAAMGVPLDDDDLALRLNLICIEKMRIKNHSAGHIGTDEAKEIIEYLNERLGSERVKFHPGVSYRHLCVIKGGSKNIKCAPPHDVLGENFAGLMIKPLSDDGIETAELLNRLILDSQELLKNHPVNTGRIQRGKDRADSIWFWSPGNRPKMKTFQELYGLHGAVISAVDLVRGIGVYAGMEIIYVDGATGLYDTNYEGKAEAAIKALETRDLVYLHIEASDEAGHEGDHELKVKTIEYLDARVMKYILENRVDSGADIAIALLPDHATPCALRTHTRDPVPFIIHHPGTEPDDVREYNESLTGKPYYGQRSNKEFFKDFIGRE